MIGTCMVFSFFSMRASSEHSQWTKHTYQVIQKAEHLISLLKDTETGQRGFLLTGEEHYLQPFLEANQAIPVAYADLQTLTADNPTQQARLISIKSLIDQKQEELTHTIALRKTSLDTALEVVRSDRGKKVMDQFRKEMGEFMQMEQALLVEYEQKTSATNGYMALNQTLVGILMLLFMAVAWRNVRRQKKSREALFQELDAQNRKYLLDNGVPFVEEHQVIESLITNLKSTKAFIEQIGNKDYSVQLQGLDASSYHLNKDNLSGALLQVKEVLSGKNQQDHIRSWMNEGIAKIGEILRANTSLDQLCDLLLKNLVKLIGANQGGIFIVNESLANEVVLEQKACYAFDRKKFRNQQIQAGEGLVGQCYLERDTIYLTEIPQGYVRITSGLGGANPSYLLLIPIQSNDRVE